ncbi:MAG: hypothetical protein KTR21_13890, partial [Rhodobacteraceae bacterium]|nr:hypothetical protein [Paracoccaceae bacterium]
CVEARPNGLDETITPPDASDPNTLFVPYFWPDEPDNVTNAYFNNWMPDGPFSSTNLRNSNQDTFNWSGPPPESDSGIWAGNPVDAGWGYLIDTELNRLANWRKYKTDGDRARIIEPRPGGKNSSRGPNMSCPPPITPLTDNATTLETARTKVQADGGTMSNMGMVWAWRVLSDGAPFSQAKPAGDAHKIAVLMSDGNSEWSWASGAGSDNAAVRTMYSSYGYLMPLGDAARSQYDGDPAAQTQGQFMGSDGAGTTFLDEKLRRVCASMKQQNIEIYTILFDQTGGSISDRTQDAYRECASSGNDFMYNPNASHFFQVFTGEELVSAYKAIGESLNTVRLIE